jgi:hypothetical protein
LVIVSTFFLVFGWAVTPEPVEDVVFSTWRKLRLNTLLRNTSAAAVQV